tara:strand:+ start:19687 stop:20664 length:978 start_codon:yes stop_codon:yes gene_type:complete
MNKLFKINGNPENFPQFQEFHDLSSKFIPFAQKKLGFDKPVGINLLSDPKNVKDPLGKTAYYDPNKMEITIFIDKRHVKDILRSLSHEMVHHTQNCRGEFDNMQHTGPGYAQKDPHLRKMEAEAYLKGNGLIFREWEDNLKQEAKKMAENNTKLKEKELEERTKRDTPDRVGGRDTAGRRVKPLEETDENTEEVVEEAGGEKRNKWVIDGQTVMCDGDGCTKREAERRIQKQKDRRSKKKDKIEEELPAGLKAYQDKKKGKKSSDEEEEKTEDLKEKKFANSDELDGDGDGKPKWADPDDPANESWFKGNKDDLLFERLVKKWCK